MATNTQGFILLSPRHPPSSPSLLIGLASAWASCLVDFPLLGFIPHKILPPKWDSIRPTPIFPHREHFFSSFLKSFQLGPTKSLNTLPKLYKYTSLLHFISKKEKTKKTHAYFSHFSLSRFFSQTIFKIQNTEREIIHFHIDWKR